jgi:hypothetical protein
LLSRAVDFGALFAVNVMVPWHNGWAVTRLQLTTTAGAVADEHEPASEAGS